MNPYGGLNALLPAVVAVIIGGKDKYLGPVIGSILIGVIRAETVWFLSSTWQDTITFLLFTIFLFFRPRGLMGRKVRLEAEP
jgi:branched-chain amino acid transport system permease protein